MQVIRNKRISLCSVCIATYRRPHLLKMLLHGLERQILPQSIIFEIIVVDNDRNRSAELVVEQYRKKTNIFVLYINQPEKNISIARNCAVKNAKGDYILFIDDDEIPTADWIYLLVRTSDLYSADAVIGLTIPFFDSKTPDWIKNRIFYYDEPDKTGLTAKNPCTANCLVRKDSIKCFETPFDYRYGVTGGEDAHFFQKIENIQKKILFCAEAVVFEYIPLEKANMKYICKRALKNGNSFARRKIEFSEKKLFTSTFQITKAIIYLLLSTSVAVILSCEKKNSAKWLCKSFGNIGKILAGLGIYYKAYR